MISKFIRHFFNRVESTPVPEPTVTELVDGQAFKIKYYPMECPVYAMPGDKLYASVTEDGELIKKVEEDVSTSMTVDTIAIIRFNDALGFKHAIGAVFGERRK